MFRLIGRWLFAGIGIPCCFWLFGCNTRNRPEIVTRTDVDSESVRLGILAESLDAGDRKVLEKFWNEVRREGTPMVEEIIGDPEHRIVTYLWRGDRTKSVYLEGGIPPYDVPKELHRLKGADLWYLSEVTPKDARRPYGFELDVPTSAATSFEKYTAFLKAHKDASVKDPLNTRALGEWSLLELPDAPRSPWLDKRPETTEGTLTIEEYPSKLLSGVRKLSFYTPSAYDPSAGTARLLVMLDADLYGTRDTSLISTPTILDNLIQERKIPPTVAVFVYEPNHRVRERDMTCNPDFAAFLAREVVPLAVEKWHLKHVPGRTIIGGESYGGLCAVYTCWKHPDVFGEALSQSGAFFYSPDCYLSASGRVDYQDPTNWLSEQIASGPPLSARIYLDIGIFERYGTNDLVAENRRIRDVLRAKGATVIYREASGTHHYVDWRQTFPDGLLELLNAER